MATITAPAPQTITVAEFQKQSKQVIAAITQHFNAYPPELAPAFEIKPINGGHMLKIRLTVFSKWDLDFIDSLRTNYCRFFNQPWMSVEDGKILVSMFASEIHIKPA